MCGINDRLLVVRIDRLKSTVGRMLVYVSPICRSAPCQVLPIDAAEIRTIPMSSRCRSPMLRLQWFDVAAN